jgi:hypothetical protein
MSVRPIAFSFTTTSPDTISPETSVDEELVGAESSALATFAARVDVACCPPVVSGEALGMTDVPNAPMTMTNTIRAGITTFPIPL